MEKGRRSKLENIRKKAKGKEDSEKEKDWTINRHSKKVQWPERPDRKKSGKKGSRSSRERGRILKKGGKKIDKKKRGE